MLTYLLHLELDGGSDVLHLALHALVVGDGGGELAGLGQTGAQDTGDQLDQGLGRQKSIVLLGCNVQGACLGSLQNRLPSYQNSIMTTSNI